MRRARIRTLAVTLILGLALASPTSTLSRAQEVRPMAPSVDSVPPIAPPRVPPILRPPRLIVSERVEQAVVIDQVDVDVEIHGSQALTRVEMHFANPNGRVLEGELSFPLLDGQQVVGMSLDIDGRLRPAVPVEKAKGRQVFDEVARRAVDPALLEKTQGENYSLRVYPIPAQGGRRVQLEILESLSSTAADLRYSLPLAWADKLARFALRLRVFGAQNQPVALAGPLGEPILARKGELYEMNVERRDFEGQGVFSLRLPAPARAQVVSQRFAGKTYFRAELPAPESLPLSRRPANRVALYWDASGSAVGRQEAREWAVLERYFQAMGEGEVTLVAFRDVPETARVFKIVAGDWRALRQALLDLPRDGATRLDNLPRIAGVGEALLVSDGLANYGKRQLPDLGVPVYSLSSAASADPAALRRWAHASGGRYADLTRLSEAQAAQAWLTRETRVDELSGDGVQDLLLESPVPEAGSFVVAGIASGDAPLLRLELRLPDGGTRRIEVPIPKPQDTALAAPAWARLQLAELEGEYALRRAEIQRLGRLFGLPSRETSLIVLDRVEDYALHGIEPPEALRAEYQRLRAAGMARQTKARAEHIEKVVAQFMARIAWWEKAYPKDTPPVLKHKKEGNQAGVGLAEAERPVMAAPSMPAREMASREMAAPAMARASAPLAGGAPGQPAADAQRSDDAAPKIGLNIKAWSPDAPYVARLKAAAAEDRYRVYLDLLPDWRAASAFYLDAAEVFFAAGERRLGLRILSNLAEMNLENRELLRILGYRLSQAEEAGLAIPVFEEVLRLAPDEPQSYRDLGLAHAQAGQGQQAIDLLWETVSRPWDGRFPDIEMTALAELNALLARGKEPLDSRAIDARLLRNLPLDVRVVLSWDTDNTDIDLWVTDPNGEKAFYSHPLTYQGGRMSRDFTGGYGPEEFALKQAKPGAYRIQAHFYGNRRQVLSGATTLSIKLYSHFGTPRQTEKLVTLRLDKARDAVDIGEFEVEAAR